MCVKKWLCTFPLLGQFGVKMIIWNDPTEPKQRSLHLKILQPTTLEKRGLTYPSMDTFPVAVTRKTGYVLEISVTKKPRRRRRNPISEITHRFIARYLLQVGRRGWCHILAAWKVYWTFLWSCSYVLHESVWTRGTTCYKVPDCFGRFSTCFSKASEKEIK